MVSRGGRHGGALRTHAKERARETGVIASQAVLVAIGIDWEGRRQVLCVELANQESHSSWRAFVAGLCASEQWDRS